MLLRAQMSMEVASSSPVSLDKRKDRGQQTRIVIGLSDL